MLLRRIPRSWKHCVHTFHWSELSYMTRAMKSESIFLCALFTIFKPRPSLFPFGASWLESLGAPSFGSGERVKPQKPLPVYRNLTNCLTTIATSSQTPFTAISLQPFWNLPRSHHPWPRKPDYVNNKSFPTVLVCVCSIIGFSVWIIF